MASVSLIIPAYNEAVRLRPFLQSIHEYLDRYPSAVQEIIVVDDGSTDSTVALVESFRALLPSLRLLRLKQNQGKGAAIAMGVADAAGDYVIFIDADGATGIEELPKMVTALEQVDIGVGNRWLRESQTVRSSWFRHLAGWTYRSYMRLFGLGDIDTMCGFKGYRQNVARDLFSNLQERRWLFDTEVAYKSVVRGYRTVNFPIAWRSVEGSKLSGITLLKTAFQIWPLIARIKKQENEIGIRK